MRPEITIGLIDWSFYSWYSMILYLQATQTNFPLQRPDSLKENLWRNKWIALKSARLNEGSQPPPYHIHGKERIRERFTFSRFIPTYSTCTYPDGALYCKYSAEHLWSAPLANQSPLTLPILTYQITLFLEGKENKDPIRRTESKLAW